MPSTYHFPVSDLSQALHVLNPNTDLDVLEENVYVNLDSIRSASFARKILVQLGISDGEFIGGERECDDKILLTGHRGSGKSVELERIAQRLSPHYLPIIIDLEKELVKLSAVTPEDLYGLLIVKFYECLNSEEIAFDTDAMQELTGIWQREQEHVRKSSNSSSLSAGVTAQAGISAWIASVKTSLSALVTANSEETEQVRQRVKADIQDILRRWNTEIISARLALRERGLHGIVFIVDGTEKISYDVAKKLFVQDAPVLHQIDAALIMASPLLGIHDIEGGPAFFNVQLFPMVQLNSAEKIAKFREIITRRVDEERFFAPGILDCIVKKSGGSIRQLLELAREALLNRQGPLVDQEALRETLYDKGLMLWRLLRQSHVDVLKDFSGDVRGGEEDVREMLFSLVLLAQNGHAIINPVVEPFVKGTKNYLCE